MREVAVRQLGSLGYAVLEAANGAQALDVIAAHPDIDLLVTDVIMPGGMTGAELAKTALTRHPALKVLFMSGYTDNAMLDHGWLEAGTELLQKPYRRADMAAKVRKALAHS
jgi:CheY-like chemotaxis protein